MLEKILLLKDMLYLWHNYPTEMARLKTFLHLILVVLEGLTERYSC